MAQHGGKRSGAGRKAKCDEQKLIEKLSPLEPLALKSLKNALTDGESWATKLYMEYAYGKPKQQVDMDVTSEGKGLNFTPISFVRNKDK